jgi:hypothetical protein
MVQKVEDFGQEMVEFYYRTTLFFLRRIDFGIRFEMEFECTEFRINLHLVAPHEHRANEQVEYYMSTIADVLRVECRDGPCTWSEGLWKIQLVSNTTMPKSRGSAPLHRLFGRKRSNN